MKFGFEKSVSQAKAPLSAALILLLLALQTLSASAVLHHDVHEDAAHADHECAVGLLSHGQVDLSETAATLAIAPAGEQLREVCAAPALVAALVLLPSTRGPPSA